MSLNYCYLNVPYSNKQVKGTYRNGSTHALGQNVLALSRVETEELVLSQGHLPH